jgi:uncharacterized protein (DUF1330 family)
MPAYVVFIREKIRDAETYAAYRERAPATLAGQPSKRLVSYGKFEVMEGAAIEGAVILEFPTMEHAKVWYNGPEYRGAREWRFKSADYRCIILEGA